MTAPGRFIVFEGLDGAGTTTQSQLLADALRGKVDCFERYHIGTC